MDTGFQRRAADYLSTDRERAAQASYSVSYAITHLDRPRFVVAYAGAMLALNPDGILEAGNAASAIATSAERLYGAAASAAKLAAARDDAAVVYRYALACSVVDDKWTLRSLGILINLGNLYVDMKSPERARPVLLAARAFAPNSWEAALALGSCYMLQGRPELARAALEDKSVKPSAIFAAATKGGAQLEAISSCGDLSPDSSEEEFEGALQTFEGKETLTAADFVTGIDPSERDPHTPLRRHSSGAGQLSCARDQRVDAVLHAEVDQHDGGLPRARRFP